jgi:hypothetical protein
MRRLASWKRHATTEEKKSTRHSRCLQFPSKPPSSCSQLFPSHHTHILRINADPAAKLHCQCRNSRLRLRHPGIGKLALGLDVAALVVVIRARATSHLGHELLETHEVALVPEGAVLVCEDDAVVCNRVEAEGGECGAESGDPAVWNEQRVRVMTEGILRKADIPGEKANVGGVLRFKIKQETRTTGGERCIGAYVWDGSDASLTCSRNLALAFASSRLCVRLLASRSRVSV